MLPSGIVSLTALVLAPVLGADALSVHQRGNDIYVSTTRLNLIEGPIQARLKNASTVAFDFHLALWSGNRSNLRRRSFERFIVSYDLWEEKYKVTGLRKPSVSAAGLTAEAVGPWCLQHIRLANLDFQQDRELWVRLDVRAVDPKQDANTFDSEGVSLINLIERISRPARGEARRWAFESGSVRVADLRP